MQSFAMAKKRKHDVKEEPLAEVVVEQREADGPSEDDEESESEESESEESYEEEEVEEAEEAGETDDGDEKEQSSSPEESSSSSSDEDEDEEPQDENSKREKIRKLLEPFSKDQIIELLNEASNTCRPIVADIIQSAKADPVHRKIFVHGLGWDATTADLISAFNQYGQLEDCKVVTDKLTNRSKGYGFVIFKTRAGAKKALKQPHKMIGKRMAGCQLAAASNSPSDIATRKLYVGNVGPEISVDRVRNMFAEYGEIEEGPSGYDRATGKFRGFAMIVYKTVEGFKKALEEPVKMLDGHRLQCSKAIEGGRASKTNPAGTVVGGSSVAGASANVVTAVAPSNMVLPTYPMGLNQGLIGQNLNQGAVLVNQNPGMNVLSSMMGMGGSLPQTAMSPSLPGGMSQHASRGISNPIGLSAGFSAQMGINSFSPSMIGNYISQAALQGLGAYQGSQTGRSSASSLPAASSDGIESSGALPSYIRH